MAVTVTVRIDPTRCRGHAICALFFTDGVELDQWGFGRVVVDSVDSARSVRRARRAAAACPNGAFLVSECSTPEARSVGAGRRVDGGGTVAPDGVA